MILTKSSDVFETDVNPLLTHRAEAADPARSPPGQRSKEDLEVPEQAVLEGVAHEVREHHVREALRKGDGLIWQIGNFGRCLQHLRNCIHSVGKLQKFSALPSQLFTEFGVDTDKKGSRKGPDKFVHNSGFRGALSIVLPEARAHGREEPGGRASRLPAAIDRFQSDKRDPSVIVFNEIKRCQLQHSTQFFQKAIFQ